MKLERGIIIKSIAGFFEVDTLKGVVTCRAKGIFRKEKTKTCCW